MTVVVHGPVPVQPPPDQPAKVALAAGAAVNVTAVPVSNSAPCVAHAAVQLMPVGADVTVPVPAPALVAVSV